MFAGQHPDGIDDDRQLRLDQLRELIRRGEYQVDPRAVADAIVRRWLERLTAQ